MNLELDKVFEIARNAGTILAKYFSKDKEFTIENKGAHAFDFVTEADREADIFIRSELAKAFPEDRILSEESANLPGDYRGRIWMVDPLDGTKYFVNGNDGFAVMIGLCVEGRPELGVVHAPARAVTYFGWRGGGAWKETPAGRTALKVNNAKDMRTARLVTRFFTDSRPEDGFVENLPLKARILEGSIGLKYGLIAEGAAEFCFLIHATHKWDVCAPQAILESAGGKVTDAGGNQVDYLAEGTAITNCIVASNGALHKEALKVANQARILAT